MRSFKTTKKKMIFISETIDFHFLHKILRNNKFKHPRKYIRAKRGCIKNQINKKKIKCKRQKII